MTRRERKRRIRRRTEQHPFRRVLLIASLLGVSGVVLALAFVATWVLSVANTSPDISQLRPRLHGTISTVYASNGHRLGYLSADVLRKVVSQGDQPKLMRQATVAIEDRRFYQHGGVDYTGILRAAINDVFSGGGLQGASTLAMQLVDNMFLPKKIRAEDKSSHVLDRLRYKIIQAKLATQLEDVHSKNWVLTQYLNDVPYGTVNGQTAIGVGAASHMFFNKPIQKLNLAQYALLAGLPQAPSVYNPFIAPGYAKTRRNQVLQAMAQSGYITQAEADKASASPLQVHPNDHYQHVSQPYVFDYVRNQLIAKLGQNVVDQGGLQVYTTINLKDQAYAKTALLANEGQQGDPAAAVATVNPNNGHILALAQNTKYGNKAGETEFDYAANGARQTGSSFKPFVLMTLIHDYDGDPNQTYYDSKFLAPGWLPGYPKYSVQTDNNYYPGPITVSQAMTASDNTVYAQLGVDVGMNKVDATAHAMGITGKLTGNPSEAIGGLKYGVSPLQMADAYATMANGGKHYSPIIISKVVLPSGKIVTFNQKPARVFSPGETYAATNVLKTVLQPGSTAPNAYYGCPAAGKTGTTSFYTDAWFVGYTPKLSTAVWVGYPNATTSMNNVNGLGPGFGGTLAAPIWHDFMQQASNGYCGDFPVPATPWVGKRYFGAHALTAKQVTKLENKGKKKKKKKKNNSSTTTSPTTTPTSSTTPSSTTTPSNTTTPSTTTTPTSPPTKTVGSTTGPTGGGGLPGG